MASGPSHALRSFREAYRRIVLLTRHEREYKEPVASAELPLVEGIRSAAIVLMVAAFEAFLRDVFEERVDELSDPPRAIGFADLPDRMKTVCVYQSLDTSMREGPGRPERRIDRLADIRDVAQRVVQQKIIGSAFAITGGNPKSGTVKTLFKQVNRPDLFASIKLRFESYWGQSVVDRFIAAKLDWIVDSRHEVAHGAGLPDWSRDDLAEAVRFIRVLARVLDDDLRIHLNGIRRRKSTPNCSGGR